MNQCLGEPHNLGKSVRMDLSGKIYKPRTIYWEWLFLSGSSPLRRLFKDKFTASDSPFSGFPDLEFEPDESSGGMYESGLVEKLEVSPIAKLTKSQSEVVGKALALCAWFGLTDLHFENMMMGLDRNKKFIFCPIDIECVFEQSELLSQTQLVMCADSDPKKVGVSQLLGLKSDMLAVGESFAKTIHLLNANKEIIFAKLQSTENIFRAKVRVVIRPTAKYVSALESGDIAKYEFCEDEIEQLGRGDVPYFYTRLDDQSLYFTGAEGSEKKSSLIREKLQCLGTYYNAKKKMFEPKFNKEYVKSAICQIVRTLDPLEDKSFGKKDDYIAYQKNKIFIKLKDRLRISCLRLSPLQLPYRSV